MFEDNLAFTCILTLQLVAHAIYCELSNCIVFFHLLPIRPMYCAVLILTLGPRNLAVRP